MSEAPRRIEITEPVTITVDGREVTVQNGELLIDACERNDAYIPRFCYHPRMEPVGMCRMCLVEVDTGRGPALQPSCMLPVTPGMTVDTTGERVAKAQDGILEFLLANHPLDCPVCDKGGECPLQDQTMAYGPGESRFVEEKRHYEKPIPISETVFLDRERCILCDRCTRFASDVAGDPLIHFIDRGSQTEVATFPDEPFASYFSGNTVQICPVGALTAKPYRFRARPWDLEETESTCTSCAVGCRMTIQSSRNQLIRFQGVDSDPVNWSWLCDKGRFGHESINSEDRLREPMRRNGDGTLRVTQWSDALGAAATALRDADPTRVAVLGGARLSNESQYAWAKLAKSVIGTDHVDAQLGDGLPGEVVFGLPGASIDDVCAKGGTVLYLGPDPKEELPVLYLRLRHAAVDDSVRIIECSPMRSGLSPYATASLQYEPGGLPALVAALCSGEVSDSGVAGVDADAVRSAAALLDGVDDLKVVAGRANLAESAGVTVDALAAVRELRPGARFLMALRRGNVRGALEAGMGPGLLPGRTTLEHGAATWREAWGSVPAAKGLDALGILDAAAEGRIDVLVLLGADPLTDVSDRSLARRAIAGAGTVISLDSLPSASTLQSDIVLPIASFGESSGTTTNLEGRVSVLNQKVTPPGTARTDWMIAAELALRLGSDLGVESSAAELWDEFVKHSQVHDGLTTAALDAQEHPDGLLPPLDPALSFAAPEPTHVPPRSSYSLRLVVNRTLYDAGSAISHCASSASLAPESTVRLSPGDAAPMGVENGTVVTVSSSHGSVSVPVTIDAGVPRGVAVMRHNLAAVDSGVLIDATEPVCDIRVELR